MATRKKGLSLDEKKSKMLELFYESKEFFQMKELEKIAPEQKGVIARSVKNVVQSLVDDGLVECEKSGASVRYRAFPFRAWRLRKRKAEDVEEQVGEVKRERTATKKEVRQSSAEREPTEEGAEPLDSDGESETEKALLEGQAECAESDSDESKPTNPSDFFNGDGSVNMGTTIILFDNKKSARRCMPMTVLTSREIDRLDGLMCQKGLVTVYKLLRPHLLDAFSTIEHESKFDVSTFCAVTSATFKRPTQSTSSNKFRQSTSVLEFSQDTICIKQVYDTSQLSITAEHIKLDPENRTVSFNFNGKLNCLVDETCKLPLPVFEAFEAFAMQAGPKEPIFGHAAKNLENIVYELAGDENRDLPFSWKYLRKLYAAQMFANNYLILKSDHPEKPLTPEDVCSMLNDVSKELSHTEKTKDVYGSTLTLRHYIDGLMLVEVCAKERINTQEVLNVIEKKLTFSHLGKGLEKIINAGREEYIKNSTRTYIS
ncbi:hypothetical protein WR25_01402 [Diploscapter pachys]|uniref:Mnd1 HTH domain-containing protein n=1 Tax=Diploscapter pachys TaxID=2018661 RepID=A0A2A2LB43_9BILA|nr:hypothetical protein WR25_01402 [Diploscapter pachys]